MLFLAEWSPSNNSIPPLSGLSLALSFQLKNYKDGSSYFLHFLTSPLHSHLPTFRCFNVHISQVCLCIYHGILCRVTAIQTVETSRGSLMLSFIYHCLYFKLINIQLSKAGHFHVQTDVSLPIFLKVISPIIMWSFHMNFIFLWLV